MIRHFLFAANLLLLLILLSACDRQMPENQANSASNKSANSPRETQVSQPEPLLSTAPTPAESPRPPATKKPQHSTLQLLHEPIRVARVELPTDALITWREYREDKPTLVLLSNDPFLQPLSLALHEASMALINAGGTAEFKEKASSNHPDPVLLPSMALSAALEAGFFSRVVWVLPLNEKSGNFSLPDAIAKLNKIGAISAAEAQTFREVNGEFSGLIAGIPFQVVTPSHLPRLDGPTLIHIDLSYFDPLYKNEISTPLFSVIVSNLEALKKQQWKATAVTLSLSNVNAGISLDVRFLGAIVERLFHTPEALGNAPLPNWQRKFDILYLNNFFQPEKILDIALEMEKSAPHIADVQFTLYQAYQANKKREEALEHLAKTVQLDSVYALEYINLAATARENGRPAEAVKMLELASQASSDNPFLRLDLAEALFQAGRKEEALRIVEQALKLPWSAVFYPEMRKTLEDYRLDLSNRPPPSRDMHAPQSGDGGKFKHPF